MSVDSSTSSEYPTRVGLVIAAQETGLTENRSDDPLPQSDVVQIMKRHPLLQGRGRQPESMPRVAMGPVWMYAVLAARTSV